MAATSESRYEPSEVVLSGYTARTAHVGVESGVNGAERGPKGSDGMCRCWPKGEQGGTFPLTIPRGQVPHVACRDGVRLAAALCVCEQNHRWGGYREERIRPTP